MLSKNVNYRKRLCTNKLKPGLNTEGTGSGEQTSTILRGMSNPVSGLFWW